MEFPAVEAGEFIELKEREVCEIEVMIAEESGTCGYALFTEYVEAAGGRARAPVRVVQNQF